MRSMRCSHHRQVFSICVSGTKLVVATAGRHIWVWDVRNMSVVLQRRESALKFQTRCVRAFPNEQGVLLIVQFASKLM